ncbi:MAG: AMP-binding protein [Acidimicrobiia bacterium]
MIEESGVLCGTSFVTKPRLVSRAARVAGGLQRLGIGPGSPVAVLARNDLVHLEVAMAAAQLGAGVVPVNWRWTADEIDYVLADSSARVIVGHADLLHPIVGALTATATVVWAPTPDVVAAVYAIDAAATTAPVGANRYDELLTGEPAESRPRDASSSALFYTSGTTGRPKGVVRPMPTAEQTALRQRSLTMTYGIKPGCRSLITTPLHHIFAQGMALATLNADGTVVVMPRFDAEEMLRLVEQHRITNLQLVPTMLVRLLRLPDEVRRRYDLSSLQRVLHTGAATAPAIKRAMLDWWGPILWEQYGSTETGVVALCSPEQWLEHPGTVGRAFLTSEIRIYDDDGRELPAGEIGRIYARMHGSPDFTYLGNPEAKAAITRGELVTSGDLGYLDDDGFLFLADRSSDMVIVGGVNVYPIEIEGVFMAHDSVRDATVFGVPDEEYGERLVGYVELEPGVSIDVDAIRSFALERLASYKVPRELVVVDAIARDDSGKISKRKLREAHGR